MSQTPNGDPWGAAINDYLLGNKKAKITVESNIAEDDSIPVSYLFRKFHEMPDLEQKALLIANGNILDIGAGVGSHSLYLQEKGMNITALEQSMKACKVMKKRGIEQVIESDFYAFTSTQKYDTILMMMNGIGIMGTVSNATNFFNHIRLLLSPSGQFIFDSSDISYLFDDKNDMQPDYFGEISYQLKYKNVIGEKFNWLFIDEKMAKTITEANGGNFELLAKGKHHEYLARITF